jgi:hypothetical protein
MVVSLMLVSICQMSIEISNLEGGEGLSALFICVAIYCEFVIRFLFLFLRKRQSISSLTPIALDPC